MVGYFFYVRRRSSDLGRNTLLYLHNLMWCLGHVRNWNIIIPTASKQSWCLVTRFHLVFIYWIAKLDVNTRRCTYQCRFKLWKGLACHIISKNSPSEVWNLQLNQYRGSLLTQSYVGWRWCSWQIVSWLLNFPLAPIWFKHGEFEYQGTRTECMSASV